MGKKRWWVTALLAEGTLLLPGAGARPRPPRPSPAAPGRPPRGTWTWSAGPGGTRISHPGNYRALFGPRGRVRILGDRGKLNLSTPFVLIQPVIPFKEETALEWLERALLPGFLSLPGARVLERKEFDPARATVLVGYPLKDIRRKALLYCALQAGTGMSYVLAAPAEGFDLVRPVLARIAMSLRYGSEKTGPEGPRGEPAPGSAFRPWVDPKEGAFLLKAPPRWKVEGGLVKRGPLDFTPTARLSSPGGRVEVFLGHRRCSYFVEPDPELLATGFQEGRWYFSSWGGSLRVLAYRPGAAFPREYIYAPPFAPEAFEVVQEHPLPELARSLAALLTGGVKDRRKVDAGYILFTFRRKKRSAAGFAVCATLRLAPRMQRRIWRPILFAGWTASPGKEALADQVLQEVLRSFRLDPAWESAQPGLDGREGALLGRAFRETASWLRKTSAQRRGALEEALRPLAPFPAFPDPAARPAWRIAAGRNYYWAPPLSPAPPDLDLSPLGGD